MPKKIFDSLDDLGRFSEPALMILISLAEGPKHGYAMTQDIEAMSGLKLGPGVPLKPRHQLERLDCAARKSIGGLGLGVRTDLFSPPSLPVRPFSSSYFFRISSIS